MPKPLTYTFPKSLGGGTVTIGDLSLENQLDAARATVEFTLTALTYEYAKRSIVRNGIDDVEFETWWNGLGEKKRGLVIKAYVKHNVPEEEEVAQAITTIKRIDLDGKERYTATIRGRLYRFSPVTVSTITSLARKSRDNMIVLNMESCIASLEAVGEEGIVDKRAFYSSLDPQERNIILRVYLDISSTSDEEEGDFFASASQDSGRGSPTSADTPTSPSAKSSP